MIPNRLFQILRSCEADKTARFPPTEIFCEGWMLRLVLDAVHSLGIQKHPFCFLPRARWYSEALLTSPFRARSRSDTLAEGFTNADAVIGHFEFDPKTRAGLRLLSDVRQFVVIEAKMFSNLSAGTKNAPRYNQAARNLACIAEALAVRKLRPGDIEQLGFFVVAPSLYRRRIRETNLEASMRLDSVRQAVRERIVAYEVQERPEARELGQWEREYFLPLVEYLAERNQMSVLSWEDCIDLIGAANRSTRDELMAFYERCLTFAPASRD